MKHTLVRILVGWNLPAAELFSQSVMSVKNLLAAELCNVTEMVVSKFVTGVTSPQAKATVNGHLQKLLSHNLLHGKCNRGGLVVNSYKALNPTAPSSTFTQIHRLGCAVEMLHSEFLVADDIMDKATERWGQTCWHKLAGDTATNDVILLRCCVDEILWQSSFPESIKAALVRATHQARHTTCVGQHLDMERPGVREYSWQRYQDIVTMKTSHYTFVYPVQLAHIAMGVPMPDATYRVLLDMGYLFQAQDDILDLGKSIETGKTAGGDIADGKCTWPLLTALNHSDASRTSTLLQAYGHPDRVDDVTEAYDHLKIRHLFDDFQRDLEKSISSQLRKNGDAISDVLFNLLHILSFRQK